IGRDRPIDVMVPPVPISATFGFPEVELPIALLPSESCLRLKYGPAHSPYTRSPMTALSVKPTDLNYSPLRDAMTRLVDEQIIPCASWALLQGRDLVDVQCVGWADIEGRTALREDHIFRIFSNTKLVTSICALQLVEAGKLGLDDPVARYLPMLQDLPVLLPGARSIHETEPQRNPITIRHLLSHSAGFTLGLFDTGTPLFDAYTERGIRSPEKTAQQMIDQLAQIPLLFQPGTELRSIVNAVNEIGASPTAMISILEALQRAGALRAELIVI
ncbi:MAG: serine hydrolase, partial [Steroidobacteraceae bacterium]